MPTPGYVPGPLVIPLTVQLRLNWVLPNSRTATNVLHAIVDPTFVLTQVIVDNVFDDISSDATTTTYMAFLAGTTALQFIDARDLRVAEQALIQSTGVAVSGGGSGMALPEEVALVCTLRSALAGRAHRGRVYLTGFDSSAIDADGHAVSGLTAAAQAWVAALSIRMEAQGLALGIGHRGHASYVNSRGDTVPAELAGTDLVTAAIVRDNVFDSQRRRK
jgi:hypothetical protein